jgi:hypothetical protein
MRFGATSILLPMSKPSALWLPSTLTAARQPIPHPNEPDRRRSRRRLQYLQLALAGGAVCERVPWVGTCSVLAGGGTADGSPGVPRTDCPACRSGVGTYFSPRRCRDRGRHADVPVTISLALTVMACASLSEPFHALSDLVELEARPPQGGYPALCSPSLPKPPTHLSLWSRPSYSAPAGPANHPAPARHRILHSGWPATSPIPLPAFRQSPAT